MNPVAFCAANLIIYWGGFEAMWKLLSAIFLGRVLFEVALRRTRTSGAPTSTGAPRRGSGRG